MSAWRVTGADELKVGDRIKRGRGFWTIQSIKEYPKTRRLRLTRGLGVGWETDIRRSSTAYTEQNGAGAT